jgi:hypothetical protein
MKSPGVIYRQYRKLYRKILYKKCQDLNKKTHDNCIYGKGLYINSSKAESQQKIKLCMYGCINIKDIEKGNLNIDNLIDTCTNPIECNAFACKRNKEDIELELKNELQDSNTKYKKYPELTAYEWVLDKSLSEAQKNPGIFNRILVVAISLLENMLKLVSGSRKNLMNNDIPE